MPENGTIPADPDLQAQFVTWAVNRHPEIVAEFEAEQEKLERLAQLEATIAEAVNKANELRAELGQGVGPAVVTHLSGDPDTRADQAPAPKKRAPRKPKPAPEPEPVKELDGDEDVPDAVVIVNGDPVETAAPEADDSDFEAFEIPADDADDEF